MTFEELMEAYTDWNHVLRINTVVDDKWVTVDEGQTDNVMDRVSDEIKSAKVVAFGVDEEMTISVRLALKGTDDYKELYGAA